ncbi:MAG: DotI/IcmL family type IV secretion protein [Gammaproteobacteria bacterium]
MPSSSITVSNKNRFSSDGVWWLRILVLIQLIFLGGLIIFNIEQFIQKPKPVYFPIKKSDQLVDNIPLDQPTLTEGELLNWVTEAMIVSFSFNYHNYDKITAKIEEYFDPLGMQNYFDLLKKDENIQQVVSNKLILSGRPTAAPRIIKDQIINGIWVWEIELPFILKFRNQIFSLDKELNLTMLILRVTETVSPVGVKIVKIQSSDR